MNIKKVDYFDLTKLVKKTKDPYSREIYLETVKEEYGTGSGIKYDFGNGIAIFARSFTLKEDMILVEKSNIRAAVFFFNLGPVLPYTYKDNKKLTLKENDFLAALASTNFHAQSLIKKNETYVRLSIGIKEELFMKLAYPIENIKEYIQRLEKNTYTIFYNGKTDPRQSEILNYFKSDNTYEDKFQNLFLESKATSLLHYTIEKVAHNLSKVADLNLDMDKINSLEKAKKLILEEYHNPLSIKEIAYKSAINECYLKKDFKAYYGMTIFEMLQKHRMENAKQLLQKRNSIIKDVALKVGYQHAGNFSKTFAKYFGMTPGEYKKNFRVL